MKNITWLTYKLEGMNMETVNLELCISIGSCTVCAYAT